MRHLPIIALGAGVIAVFALLAFLLLGAGTEPTDPSALPRPSSSAGATESAEPTPSPEPPRADEPAESIGLSEIEPDPTPSEAPPTDHADVDADACSQMSGDEVASIVGVPVGEPSSPGGPAAPDEADGETIDRICEWYSSGGQTGLRLAMTAAVDDPAAAAAAVSESAPGWRAQRISVEDEAPVYELVCDACGVDALLLRYFGADYTYDVQVMRDIEDPAVKQRMADRIIAALER